MRRDRIGTVVALIAAIAIARSPFSARAADGRADQVTVPQSALNSLIGEPDRHFHRAADLYAKGSELDRSFVTMRAR